MIISPRNREGNAITEDLGTGQKSAANKKVGKYLVTRNPETKVKAVAGKSKANCILSQ